MTRLRTIFGAGIMGVLIYVAVPRRLSAARLEPPAQNSESSSKPKPNSATDNATKNAPDQPMWDPLRAEKDIEVGQFYMKKGDVDAAIDRFADATLAKPGYAIPFRYLGEAQEKKGLKRDAIKSYTRYLNLYPHAEDKEKIQKKIDRLWKEVKSKKGKGVAGLPGNGPGF